MSNEKKVDIDYQIPIKEVIPLKGVRKGIARFLTESAKVPTACSHSEIDMTEAVKFHKTDVAKLAEKENVRITMTHIMLKACAEALKKMPIINSSCIVDEKGDPKEIRIYSAINIGMIVSTDDDLNIIPVLHDVDKLTLPELAQYANEVAETTRKGIFPRENFVGGTFTLTNLGMFGVKGVGMPMIGQPQAAIVATGVIEERPVVRDHQIVIRQMMWASMTYDHRHLTGGLAGRFRQTIADILENPYKFKKELGI